MKLRQKLVKTELVMDLAMPQFPQEHSGGTGVVAEPYRCL